MPIQTIRGICKVLIPAILGLTWAGQGAFAQPCDVTNGCKTPPTVQPSKIVPGPLAASVITTYTSRAAWQAAVGTFVTEPFNAGGLQPFTGVTTSVGQIGPARGVLTGSIWRDRVTRAGVEQTTFSYKPSPIIGAGAEWDTSPGGEGQALSISITFPDGTTQFIAQIGPNDGPFFGWTSSQPFTSFTIVAGNGPGVAETFDMDNLSFAPAAAESTYQLRYLANLDKGDSYVNLTNAGTLDGRAPAGNICANVYTFDPAEELISCCACPITPNGLVSLSARNDLISNTLTPGVPTSVTVKILSTAVFGTVGGVAGTNISATACNAAGPGTGAFGPPPVGNVFARGMRAWATTLHLNTSGSPAVGYQKTETPFSVVELSDSELAKLTSFCGFIQANGSGFGICKACRFGALGGEQK